MSDKQRQGMLISALVLGILYILFGTNLTSAPQDLFADDPGMLRVLAVLHWFNSKVGGRLLLAAAVMYGISAYQKSNAKMKYPDFDENLAYMKYWWRIDSIAFLVMFFGALLLLLGLPWQNILFWG